MAKARVRAFNPARLLTERRQRGLSQSELATALGCSVGSVGHWESGTHRPDLDSALTLAEMLGLDLAELMTPPDEHWLLADYRQRAGLQQNHAADSLGWTVTELGRLERGERTTTDEQAHQLAELYATGLDEITAASARTVAARTDTITRKLGNQPRT